MCRSAGAPHFGSPHSSRLTALHPADGQRTVRRQIDQLLHLVAERGEVNGSLRSGSIAPTTYYLSRFDERPSWAEPILEPVATTVVRLSPMSCPTGPIVRWPARRGGADTSEGPSFAELVGLAPGAANPAILSYRPAAQEVTN